MPHVFLGVGADKRSRHFVVREQAFITASMIIEDKRRKKERKENGKKGRRYSRRR